MESIDVNVKSAVSWKHDTRHHSYLVQEYQVKLNKMINSTPKIKVNDWK